MSESLNRSVTYSLTNLDHMIDSGEIGLGEHEVELGDGWSVKFTNPDKVHPNDTAVGVAIYRPDGEGSSITFRATLGQNTEFLFNNPQFISFEGLIVVGNWLAY